MPTFQEQMELDLDVFINPDEFGIPAVYNPVIDDSAIFEPVSCNVIIDHDVILQPSDFDAQVVETGTTLEAIYSVVAVPQKGSTFVADGKVYTVQRVQDNDKALIKMVVTEKEEW